MAGFGLLRTASAVARPPKRASMPAPSQAGMGPTRRRHCKRAMSIRPLRERSSAFPPRESVVAAPASVRLFKKHNAVEMPPAPTSEAARKAGARSESRVSSASVNQATSPAKTEPASRSSHAVARPRRASRTWNGPDASPSPSNCLVARKMTANARAAQSASHTKLAKMDVGSISNSRRAPTATANIMAAKESKAIGSRRASLASRRSCSCLSRISMRAEAHQLSTACRLGSSTRITQARPVDQPLRSD